MRLPNCGVVAVLAACCTLSACKPPAPPAVEVIRPVRAVKLGDARQLEGRSFPGVARATREVNLSFRVSGPLITRQVNVGDEVKAGQVLARIDPRDFDVQLRRVNAELSNAEATRTLTQDEYERALTVREAGALTAIELARKLEARDGAGAQVEALQASVDAAQDALDYTQLKASFDGVVTAIYVENFEEVQAKQSICRLLDDTRIEVRVELPGSGISVIRQADDLDIWCTFSEFPDLQLPATIKEIGTEASAVTRTYPVTLIMDQPDGVRILPGMPAEVRGRATLPETVRQSGFELPASAVIEGEDGVRYVWTIDEATGRVSRRAIEVAAMTAIGFQVTGLEPGEWVATAGAHYLEDGQTVRIMDAG